MNQDLESSGRVSVAEGSKLRLDSGNHIFEAELIINGTLETQQLVTVNGRFPSLCEVRSEGWTIKELRNAGTMTITTAGKINKVEAMENTLTFMDEIEITELSVKSHVAFEKGGRVTTVSLDGGGRVSALSAMQFTMFEWKEGILSGPGSINALTVHFGGGTDLTIEDLSLTVLSAQWEDALSGSSLNLQGTASLTFTNGFSGTLNSYSIKCPEEQGSIFFEGDLTINKYLEIEGCTIENSGSITVERGAQFLCHSELTTSGLIEMKEETVSEFGKLQVRVGSSFASTGRVTFTDYVLIQSTTFSASEMVSSGTVSFISSSNFPESSPVAQTLKIFDGEFTLERGQSQSNIHIPNIVIQGGTFESKHELKVKLVELKEGSLILKQQMDLERLVFFSGDVNGGPRRSTLAVDVIDIMPSTSKSFTSVEILVRTSMNWNTNPFSDVISMSGSSQLTVDTGATMNLVGKRSFKSIGSSGKINNKGTVTHTHSALPEDSIEIECDFSNEGTLNLNQVDTVIFSGSLQSTNTLDLHPQGTLSYGARSLREPINIVANLMIMKGNSFLDLDPASQIDTIEIQGTALLNVEGSGTLQVTSLRVFGSLSLSITIEADELAIHSAEITGYGETPVMRAKKASFTGNTNKINTAAVEASEEVRIQCNILEVYKSEFTATGSSDVVLDGILEIRLLEASTFTINEQSTMTSKSHSIFVTSLKHREPEAVPGYIHIKGNVVAEKNLTVSCPTYNDGGSISVMSDESTVVIYQGSTTDVALPNNGQYTVNGENCELIFDGDNGDAVIDTTSNFPASTRVVVSKGTVTINTDTTTNVLDATFSLPGGHLVLMSDSSTNTVKEVTVSSLNGLFGSLTLQGQNHVNINSLTLLAGNVEGKTGKISKFTCFGHGEVATVDVEELEIEELEIKGTFAITGVTKVSSRLESYDETHRHPAVVTLRNGTLTLMAEAKGIFQTSIDFTQEEEHGQFVIAGELSILKHSIVHMGADFIVQPTGSVIIAESTNVYMQSLFVVDGTVQLDKISSLWIEGPSSLSGTSVFGK